LPNRSVVSHAPTQLVTDALVMAIWRRGKPDALLHHSDRDSQYTSEQFQRLMADHGVVCSMSRSPPALMRASSSARAASGPLTARADSINACLKWAAKLARAKEKPPEGGF
jgi:hypothetical protein